MEQLVPERSARLLRAVDVAAEEGILEADFADISRGEPGVPLDPMSLVSMNFWGFSHRLFPAMQEAFDSFLRKLSPDDVRGEYPLPVMVDRLLKRDIVSIEVLKTAAVWFGVTYQEDRPKVQQALSDLHTAGIYGNRLF